jgi:hypothetical protein
MVALIESACDRIGGSQEQRAAADAIEFADCAAVGKLKQAKNH